MKRHFDVLLEKMTQGILELTPDGRIVYANPSGISLINIPENKLLGSNFVDLFRDISYHFSNIFNYDKNYDKLIYPIAFDPTKNLPVLVCAFS